MIIKYLPAENHCVDDGFDHAARGILVISPPHVEFAFALVCWEFHSRESRYSSSFRQFSVIPRTAFSPVLLILITMITNFTVLAFVGRHTSEQEDAKTDEVPAVAARNPAIKGILKTTSTSPESPLTNTQDDVAANEAATDPKRRGVLRKQLSFETEEPAAESPRLRPRRPDSAGGAATAGAPAAAGGNVDSQGGAAVQPRTPAKIKNKAVARRLMLRDRRSVDDEAVTSFLEEEQSLNDGR